MQDRLVVLTAYRERFPTGTLVRLVDAILGYAIARHEILRRAPHAIVSGTLARDEA